MIHSQLSVFRKSAWEYREEVGKYYLHQFVIGQPDFNYRNPDVVDEMKNIIRFWFDKGVAGFRVDAIAHLFEVDKEKFGGKYPDEPTSGNNQDDPLNHGYLDHIYTIDQDETYDMVYQWRDVYNEYKAKDDFSRVMMIEIYASPQKTMRYFGEGDREGGHMPFNFALIADVNGESTANEIKYAVDKYLTFKPIDKLANWVVRDLFLNFKNVKKYCDTYYLLNHFFQTGNHDNNRVASRYSPELVDGMNMMSMLLPGIAVTYMVRTFL